MSDLIWLSEAQMRRIEPYFPLSHGVPRVDDRRIISGIIFVIRNGLRWRDAPADYGPPKTIYNRFIRWSRLGVFNKICSALSAQGGKPDQLMIDATHLKAHRWWRSSRHNVRQCHSGTCPGTEIVLIQISMGKSMRLSRWPYVGIVGGFAPAPSF